MKIFQLFPLLLSPACIVNAFVGSPAISTNHHPVGVSLSVNTAPFGLSAPTQSIWTRTPALFAKPGDKEISDEDEMARARQYLASLDDGTDVEAVMSLVAEMKARPALSKPDVSIATRGCAVDIAIDVIALALDAVGIPGGKTVAGKLWDYLPAKQQKQVLKLVKEMEANNAAESIWEVMKIIGNGLTWNAIKDSFSEFGFWESLELAASLLALFVSGGTALIINLGLMGYAIGKIIVAITQCDEL